MKKKKKSPVLVVVTILFGIYLALYVAFKSGYFEYKEYNKMTLTEEAMKRFESDVENGKDITLSDYITDNTLDYTNNVSKLGFNTSKALEKFFNEGLGGFFKVMGALFTD